MRLTIGKKINIAMAIMVALVAILALTANVSMFVVQKNAHNITTKSIPLVIACQEMNAYKTLARFELRDYLIEDDPEKLVVIEKRFWQYVAAHDVSEKKICDAIDNLSSGNQQLKGIWQEAMATVMPDFDNAADEAIETHNNLIKICAKRMAVMDVHEEKESGLFKLIIGFQNKTAHIEKINRSLIKINTFYTLAMFDDEEYITKGMMLSSQQRQGIRKEFQEHSGDLIEQLNILKANLDSKSKYKIILNELLLLSNEFIYSVTGENQLFELFDKEFDYHQKEKELIAETDKLGDADSEMASKLTLLAAERLNAAGLGARQSASKISRVLVVLCVLALIVSLMVTTSISKQIVKPILALADASGKIAAGDLSQRIDVCGGDEICELCRSFNKMSENLHSEVLVRQKAEKEREKLLEILEEKNRELQNVVYVASHDLRSPLVTINGFSEELGILCGEIENILETENIDEDVKKKIIPLLKEGIPEDLRFITAGAEKMQMLIGGLLQISRAGSAETEMALLNMNEMLENICEAMQYDLSSKDVSINLRDLPSCFGDAGMINQVFSNLLDNAVKYRKSNGGDKIVVSGWVESGNSVYCVEDNGIGISANSQSKIFEVFHRLDPQGAVSGEGLGLTIISRILDRHSGKIWVESEPDEGSRFFVSIPTSG